MEWIEQMNRGIRYIEQNLTGRVDPARLGQICGCSAGQFQRMFSYLAGVPLSVYLRRRRMSRAAADLQAGGKVIEVAARYGYDSPTAFHRAFRSVHGAAPSAVRDGRAPACSYPPILFHLTVQGVCEMNYRIVTRDAFRVAGVGAPIHPEMEKNFAAVPALWHSAVESGTLARLLAQANGEPQGLLGVCDCRDPEAGRYLIAVATDAPADGWEAMTIPPACWAVFPGAGTSRDLQALERRIFTEWLPASGYVYGDAPDIEVYKTPNPADTAFEVWVPVKKAP